MDESGKFISSQRAAEISGYAKDYIGQLCRCGKIKSRRVGRDWFVDVDDLLLYKNKKLQRGMDIIRMPAFEGKEISSRQDSLKTKGEKWLKPLAFGFASFLLIFAFYKYSDKAEAAFAKRIEPLGKEMT